MSTLVVYSTLTGNTEKVAKAVFEVISGEKELKMYRKLKKQRTLKNSTK